MAPSNSTGKPAMWRGVQRPVTGQLLVSEIFGPSLQGEGPSAGKPAAFIRVGGCNLTCSWCDTRYTWDHVQFPLSKELTRISTLDVARRISGIGADLVIITGGEPALQASELFNLVNILRQDHHRVEIETSGTIPLGPLADILNLIVVSPKLSNSGLKKHQRIRPQVLKGLTKSADAVFKFVIESLADFNEVQDIVDEFEIVPSKIWVMPEGRTREIVLERLAELAQPAVDRGWSVSNRLHVLLWGDQRGR